MCGIAGILMQGNPRSKEKMIREMTRAVVHRGPDGEGFFLDENLALGHRRLSIIDLTEAGHQPMHSEDKYVLVFNGEIYNYLEVRSELLALGYVFHTASDTEVILAAYDKWGEDCVQRFNGMWAFALYDKSAQKVFCSRDRFGVKPFYFTQHSSAFFFGSELKQLLLHCPRRKANLNVLMDYLVLGLEDHNEETFFEGITKLQAGHNLLFDLRTHSYSIQQYYSIRIDKSASLWDEQESTARFRKELERSISYRMRSDVKVGTCLSGGLDSSSIASLSARLYATTTPGRKFTAITASSEDKVNDEFGYAKMVVDSSGLDWNVVKPSAADFRTVMEEVIRTQEEPFGSPSVFMQYFVMQKSRALDCPVLLDGQGGDEILLGYERYYPAYLMSLPWRLRLKGLLSSSRNSKLSAATLFRMYFYFTNSGLRMKRQRSRSSFVKPAYFDLLSRDLLEKIAASYSDIQEMQKLELTHTQLPHLLRYEDRNSMRHSVESRLPFLDFQLVEMSLSLNNSFKIREGFTKYILRKATEDVLPREIAWRKNKFGFESPPSWLSDQDFFLKQIQSSEILRKISISLPTQMKDTILLWRLYNISKWEEAYEVSVD